MANTIIIDGNSIGHANHNGTVLTAGGMEVQAIFGEKLPEWKQLVLWDGKAHWRFEACPEYKGTRVAKDDKEAAHKASYKAQSPFIRKALQLLGVRQMLASSAEADDMAGLISKRLSVAGNKVLLVTGDKDWIQLVNENAQWFDPIRDRRVTCDNFFEFTGYRTPEQFVDGKALMGDGSDNISPVGGIGEKGAPVFVAEFGSVKAFFEQVDSGVFVPKKKAHIRLCGSISWEDWEKKYEGDRADEKAVSKHMDKWPGDGRLVFERNRKIMNLLDVPTPPKEDVTVIPATFDKEKFRVLCERLAFASILRDLDSFVAPFERNMV